MSLEQKRRKKKALLLAHEVSSHPQDWKEKKVEVPHGAPRKGVEQGPVGSRFGSYEAKPSDTFGRESLAFPEYLLHARQCAGRSHVLPH